MALISCKDSDVLYIPPPRIVSLLPNVTETIFALGMGDHLVGVTRYCTRPDAAKMVSRVGGILDISVEEIFAKKPTIIIGSPYILKGRIERLAREMGVDLLPLSFETPESVMEGITTLGKKIDREKQALILVEDIKKDLESLRGALLSTPKIKVLFLVGRHPFVVASNASFIGDILERMGVENVVSSKTIPFPVWSFEQIIDAQPDVIVDASVEDSGTVFSEIGIQAKVIKLEDDAVIRPGPSFAKGALDLAKRIKMSISSGR